MVKVGVCALRMVLLASLTLFLAPASALALALGASSEPFTLSIDPSSPAAFGTITLTPIPGDIDLSAATMTVVINSKQIMSGAAAPINIKVGAAGQVETITVSMKTAKGTYKQVASVTPEDVVLIAEPLASAPPLYPGKPLVPVGGSVRVVAVADLRTTKGAQLDPATLSYDWNVDDTEVAASSGIGKRSMIVDSPLEYRSSTVQVTVTSPDGTLVAHSAIDLTAAEPAVRVYERDPLMGILFDQALPDTFAIKSSEVTLYGAPYSFPTALGGPTLSWYVGGALAQGGSLITLRPTGGAAGTASVSLTGAPTGVDGVRASQVVSVSFGSGASGGLFGL